MDTRPVSDLVFQASEFVRPVAWVAFGVAICLLGSMALFRSTRSWAGGGIIVTSWVVSLATWLLASWAALAIFGWSAVIIGWLMLGIGVVPIAVFGAFFEINNTLLGWTLIIMSAVVYGMRVIGAALIESK